MEDVFSNIDTKKEPVLMELLEIAILTQRIEDPEVAREILEDSLRGTIILMEERADTLYKNMTSTINTFKEKLKELEREEES